MKGGEGDFLLESDFLFASKKSDSSNKSSFYHYFSNKKYPVICILPKAQEINESFLDSPTDIAQE